MKTNYGVINKWGVFTQYKTIKIGCSVRKTIDGQVEDGIKLLVAHYNGHVYANYSINFQERGRIALPSIKRDKYASFSEFIDHTKENIIEYIKESGKKNELKPFLNYLQEFRQQTLF